ncbi:glycosyl-4,4'-diaponeurosporenoate acyltransferase CrtO family protein [Parapedobacter soli]|uniref:glycosyl-4,4'-diaponeurosporenoate acyltransferase CrtO family protein n=1 Tax=Parapedobacter soli TaxID=416955 RepID=UPI0036F2F990
MVIAVLFSVLPQKVLQQLTIGNNQTVYEKWGVKFIRKFVQDGDWIKSWSNGSLPLRIGNKFQARRYLTTIAMYERFHWTCFMFFAGTAVYAIIIGHVWISLWITVTNIAYNVTSIMLQQYNRLRINRLYKIIG